MVLVEDQGTGNWISIFMRRGRVYMYLVDRYSYMFIRRIYEVWEYCGGNIPYFSKDKPLFLDILIMEKRRPEDLVNKTKQELEEHKEIEDEIETFLVENYNELVARMKEPGTKWYATELVKGCGWTTVIPEDIRSEIKWDETLFLAQARKDEKEYARTGSVPKIAGRYPFPW
jgi:hypothetical protein